MKPENNMERIPVTIITGFLGAGKTTLLNHLIQSNPEKRIAIIENEFGETPIDNELVVSTDNDIFELSNGCICCSLNDDLTPVLIKLLNNKGRKADHLIVETTGIADPGPVANSFLGDPKIRSIFYIDSIITIVDGQFIEQQLENFDEACKQVALADVVLINKSDKIEEYDKDTISNIVKGINPQALLFKCAFGKVEDSDLLNMKSFDAAHILKTTIKNSFVPSNASKFTLNFKKQNTADNSSVVVNDIIKHLKHQDITSESFVFPEAIDPVIFSIWIQMTLNLKNMEIYRAKGILQFKNNSNKVVFQAVNNQYITENAGAWAIDEKISKIVFIGKNLQRKYFEEGLRVCISDISSESNAFYQPLFDNSLLV